MRALPIIWKRTRISSAPRIVLGLAAEHSDGEAAVVASMGGADIGRCFLLLLSAATMLPPRRPPRRPPVLAAAAASEE